MKRFKITFFNPITLDKNEYRFQFTFDGLNHEWDYIMTSFFGSSEHSTRKSPLDEVKWIANNLNWRKDYYLTIKSYN